MSNIRFADRAGRRERHIPRATNRHRLALAAGSVLVVAALLGSPGGAMAGCNSGNVANTALLSSATCQASAPGELGTAVGRNAQATGPGSIAIGAGASPDVAPRALGAQSIAIGAEDPLGDLGFGALAGAHGIAIGVGAVAHGIRSTIVGSGAGSEGATNNHSSSAFGGEAGVRVTGFMNTAIGGTSGRSVTGDSNTALGGNAGTRVTGDSNTASGALAGRDVEGSANGAYGHNAGGNVTGMGNVAVGWSAGRSVTANHTVAIGTSSRARGGSAIAIGNATLATGARSVAIGFGSVTAVADTVSVGSVDRQRRIMNVAPAINPTDAVNLAQVQALVAAAGDPFLLARLSTARSGSAAEPGAPGDPDANELEAEVATSAAPVEIPDARSHELITLLSHQLHTHQQLLLSQQRELAELRARVEILRAGRGDDSKHVSTAGNAVQR